MSYIKYSSTFKHSKICNSKKIGTHINCIEIFQTTVYFLLNNYIINL